MIKYTGANYLNIPQTLIEKYQPVIGPVAAMVWINLLYLSKEQVSTPFVRFNCVANDYPF
jgi:hypothetical protein